MLVDLARLCALMIGAMFKQRLNKMKTTKNVQPNLYFFKFVPISFYQNFSQNLFCQSMETNAGMKELIERKIKVQLDKNHQQKRHPMYLNYIDVGLLKQEDNQCILIALNLFLLL